VVVDHKVIANARTVVDLAAHGLPVTSNNARSLVQFLDEYEALNLAHLPAACVSHTMGWQGEGGECGFLWGRNLITAGGGGAPQSPGAQPVRFRGADEGDDQLADGYRATGTCEGWVEAAKLLRKCPRALVGLYAAFVPPMLQVLGSSNFVVDYAGDNTSGKTSTLRVVAGVWGDPDERNAGAVLSTWNSTATWRERVPAVCCHLPLVLDDTKNMRFPDEVAKTVYGVAQGRCKGRGTVLGVARQDRCVTVLFSSGEQPVTSFTRDGGTRARALSFWGSPFGEVSPAMGGRIREVNPREPSYRQFYRNRLFTLVESCAGTGDAAGAVQAAEQLRDLGWDPPVNAFDAACTLGLCVQMLDKDEPATKEERAKQARLYGDQAMTMLQSAVSKGYRDAARMKQDRFLNALRQRDDFKKLLAEVERKAKE
jgi:hypothetical protein